MTLTSVGMSQKDRGFRAQRKTWEAAGFPRGDLTEGAKGAKGLL